MDKHVNAGRGDNVAILWEGNDVGNELRLTYKDVLAKTCQLANYLRKRGVKKGDRVCIYMPMVPELPIAMLACARIGAVHSVVFGGFSAESLAGRILDCKSDVLLSCSAVKRGAKGLNLKGIVDEALRLCLEKENFQPGEQDELLTLSSLPMQDLTSLLSFKFSQPIELVSAIHLPRLLDYPPCGDVEPEFYLFFPHV